ncbi:4-hydroxy-tetrahydrodipicolinate synthase [Fodinisporobacter ferrooxydans]|uniref:4-hydroxy-tetrahydrodipicolinate synthase n=1 Tax=Fodinisporobacter ferrooxydans TaxID=2901836 RepID=A0ABY4CPF0_9BACL|nr:4-hydroxy-tetrahydrodipicolinate synthase [Alicyclobacillaceae bacterium MYW30-H2]
MLKPAGIIPAMITPFTKEQEINEPGLRQLVNRLIKSGVHGLFCFGTNGEFFSLTFDEKVQIAEIVVDEVNGRVPVYVGAGCISTAETIKLSNKLEVIGVDAVSVITPFFLTYTQKELIKHYQSIADTTRLPIVLYNIPSRTGNSLQPNTVAELSKISNIVGIKDSSGSFDNILRYLDHVDSDFSVMAGTDSLILPTLMAGGKGAIASTANVLPKAVVSIYENWKLDNIHEAEKAQDQLRALRAAMNWGTLPSVLKEAMNIIGLPAGPTRSPVEALSEESHQKLIKVMQKYIEDGIIIAP